jgi:hypothetical protein
MYAENRGSASDVERPPEMMMPTGSSNVASVFWFMLECGERDVPGTGGDADLKAPLMPAKLDCVTCCPVAT